MLLRKELLRALQAALEVGCAQKLQVVRAGVRVCAIILRQGYDARVPIIHIVVRHHHANRDRDSGHTAQPYHG